MKRFISFLLAFLIVFSSISSIAAPGDIIHTGKTKLFKANDLEGLLSAINSNYDPNLFYRENSDGTYTNIAGEQKEQLELLTKKLQAGGIDINDPDAVSEYLLTLKDLEDELKKVTTDNTFVFDDIPYNTGTKEDYYGGAVSTDLKSGTNYSIPEPGSKDGTTMIRNLILPNGSSKWLYKVLEEKEKSIPFNTEIKGTEYKEYKKEQDIEITADKYVGLYATDQSNRMKAYANILIDSKMIRRSAERLSGGTVNKGTSLAYAVSLNGLTLSGDHWKYFVRDQKLADIFRDNSFADANAYGAGQDIVVADDKTSIGGGLKKYIYLINGNESISEFYEFEVELKEGKISLPPGKLENTSYKEPVPGSTEGTTMFDFLNLEGTGGSKWVYKIGDNINIPIADSILGGDFKALNDDGITNIEVAIGNNILIAAVDDSKKIKSYEIFTLKESNISGIKAATFAIVAEKGHKPGTTMVKDITLPEGASKWMYAVGKSIATPYLNRVYEGARDYTLGTDIDAKVGDTLYVFASDDGKVKEYGVGVFVSLGPDHIKASLADDISLDKGLYLKDPIKGSAAGSIKFEFLNGNLDFDYKFLTSLDPIPVPEKGGSSAGYSDIALEGSGTENIILPISEDELRADNGFSYNMMIVAVNKAVNKADKKIQAYYSFKANKSNVRLPEAGDLNQNGFTNYSTPIKGNGQNTTRIKNLDPSGLSNVTSFKYDLTDDAGMIIEHNTIISSARTLIADRDIPAKVGQHLLILAVDSAGRTKYYAKVKLEGGISGNIMSSNASPLIKGTHFAEPLPGKETPNSTRVNILTPPQGVTQWRYVISDSKIDSVEAGVPMADSKVFTSDQDIATVKAGQYLLILGTDGTDDANGNVLYHYNHRLLDSNIRGGASGVLTSPLNYIIDKGTKAGSTQFTKLDGSGLTNSSTTKWKWKLVEKVPTDLKDKPYLGGEVSGSSNFFNVNSDINVSEHSPANYGYILLLATDPNGKTKAYNYIQLDSSNVKEHAPIIVDASLGAGSLIDTTKVSGLASGKNYKYIIGSKAFDTPSLGDFLPVNPKEYPLGAGQTFGGDIKVKFGDHLTIFELDEDGKIGRFKAFEIKADDDPLVIKQGKAEFKLETTSIPENTLLEGTVNNGGKRLTITLTDGKWIKDLDKNPNLRKLLYEGLVANNQKGEWARIVGALVGDGIGNIEITGDNILTITLVGESSFDIKDEQEISMVIHPDLIQGASNSIYAGGKITIKPTIGAKLSGTLLEGSIRANDLKLGGKTLIIDLVDGSWKGSIDEVKLKTGLMNEDTPYWNSMLDKLESGNINRSSSTRVIITLPPVSDLEWKTTNSETITVKIDSDLLLDDTEKVEASPRFTIYPDILKVNGKAKVGGVSTDTVLMKANEGKDVREDKNLWRIEVDAGTLKNDLSINDLQLSLPKGLMATASKASDPGKNIIDIIVSGTSTTKITNNQVFLSIKGSAVTEPNSLTSDAIELKIVMAPAETFNGVSYSIGGGNLVFTGMTANMEYMDSLNGIWLDGKDNLTLSLVPRTLIVREKLQPKVIKEFKFTNEEKAPDSGFSISKYDYSVADKVTVTLNVSVDNLEYSVNNGGAYANLPLEDNVDISLAPDEDLILRYKAVDGVSGVGKLPSKPTTKLNGEYLGHVELAAAQGKVLKTNTNMQYTLQSENGTDGIWAPARDKETPFALTVDNYIWIRDKSDFKNFRKLGKVIQTNIPDLTMVDFNIKLGQISNNSAQGLEYKIPGGLWTTLKSSPGVPDTGIVFKPGYLEFRVRANGGLLASQAVKKEPVIQEMKAMPVVVIDDVRNKVVSINGITEWDNFEYRVNPSLDTPWSGGNILKDADLSGVKTLEIRFMAKEHVLPSQSNNTVKFTENLDMSQVVLSDYTNPPVLNGTTNLMEYKIIYLNGEEVGWNQCGNKTTPLNGLTKIEEVAQIILRDRKAGQTDNMQIVLNNAPSAPRNVEITKYTYGDDGKYSVKLSGVFDTMEYSLNAGKDWTPITSVTINGLDDKSDLRVRYKEKMEGDKKLLPSITTPKLNGTYLGGISIDDGSLLGTDASMEYRLNGDGPWTVSKNNPTTIEIALGSTINIRQVDNHINSRNIGPIQRGTLDLDYLKQVDYSIINRKIIRAAGLDYRINSGSWISIEGHSATDVNFDAGPLEFRTSAKGLFLESEAQLKKMIANPLDGPDVRIIGSSDKSIEYYNDSDKKWIKIDDGFDYKIGSNGDWKSASNFKNDTAKDGNVSIFVRRSATHNTLPSKEKSANTFFANVKSDIASNFIEGTTTSMEYSFDFDEAGQGNSSWTVASNGKTSITFVEGMNVWIRDKESPHNYVHLVTDVTRLATPTNDDLDFDILAGTITNKSNMALEYRIKEGSWKKLAAKATVDVIFTEGNLEFKRVATVDKLESKIKKRFVISSAKSAPLVDPDDESNKINKIGDTTSDDTDAANEWKKYQYRIGKSGNWLPADLLLGDIDLSGKITVQIRRKAGFDTLASQIKKVEFTEDEVTLHLSHVTLSDNVTPLELNGTTKDMQYRLLYQDVHVSEPVSTSWKVCIPDSNGNTKLEDHIVKSRIKKIEIREIGKDKTTVTIYPKPQP